MAEKVKLNMPSRTHKVKISNELLEKISGMNIKYRLN
jgi:hypothetical protein